MSFVHDSQLPKLGIELPARCTLLSNQRFPDLLCSILAPVDGWRFFGSRRCAITFRPLACRKPLAMILRQTPEGYVYRCKHVFSIAGLEKWYQISPGDVCPFKDGPKEERVPIYELLEEKSECKVLVEEEDDDDNYSTDSDESVEGPPSKIVVRVEEDSPVPNIDNMEIRFYRMDQWIDKMGLEENPPLVITHETDYQAGGPGFIYVIIGSNPQRNRVRNPFTNLHVEIVDDRSFVATKRQRTSLTRVHSVLQET